MLFLEFLRICFFFGELLEKKLISELDGYFSADKISVILRGILFHLTRGYNMYWNCAYFLDFLKNLDFGESLKILILGLIFLYRKCWFRLVPLSLNYLSHLLLDTVDLDALTTVVYSDIQYHYVYTVLIFIDYYLLKC